MGGMFKQGKFFDTYSLKVALTRDTQLALPPSLRCGRFRPLSAAETFARPHGRDFALLDAAPRKGNSTVEALEAASTGSMACQCLGHDERHV